MRHTIGHFIYTRTAQRLEHDLAEHPSLALHQRKIAVQGTRPRRSANHTSTMKFVSKLSYMATYIRNKYAVMIYTTDLKMSVRMTESNGKSAIRRRDWRDMTISSIINATEPLPITTYFIADSLCMYPRHPLLPSPGLCPCPEIGQARRSRSQS